MLPLPSAVFVRVTHADITADCDADADIIGHRYTAEEQVRQVLHAGTDNDCGTFVTDHAMAALNQSLITVGDIEARLRMMFRVRMRLMHFDPVSTIMGTITFSAITLITSYSLRQHLSLLLLNELTDQCHSLSIAGPTTRYLDLGDLLR